MSSSSVSFETFLTFEPEKNQEFYLKAYVFMKPAKKSLDSLAGKLNLNFGRCGSAGL